MPTCRRLAIGERGDEAGMEAGGKGPDDYKGYLGIVEYDEDAKVFTGDVINTRDVITFQGTSVRE
jgi:hypothetical protein